MGFSRHQGSKSHARAVASDGSGSAFGAPTLKQFADVLEKPFGAADDLGPKKTKAMRWCLSEAVMDKERHAARHAHTSLYSQDGCDGYLLSRISTSTFGFELHCFIVGYTEQEGTNAIAIARTTKKGIERWCTPRLEPPLYGRVTESIPATMDVPLYDTLCASVKGAVTDAASDEFRAIRLVSGASSSIELAAANVIFPGVIIHGKDPTHASGRFLKVWEHDHYLSAVFALFVNGPNSMAVLIANSPDIRRRFKIKVHTMGTSDIDSVGVRHMGFCQPRFSSAVLPLGRNIVLLDATLGLAVELSAVRSGDEPARGSQCFFIRTGSWW